MNLLRKLAILGHAVVAIVGTSASTLRLLGAAAGLDILPLGAHVGNLGLPVLLGVIRLAVATEALPHAQMLGVDGDTVVLVGAALANVAPAALLLLEVKAGGVGEVEPGEEHTSQTEPGNNVELGLGVNVSVEDRGQQGTSFAQTGREAVGGGTNGGGEHLASNQEGDRVGTKLVEKGRDKVHGLEGVDAGRRRVVLVLEGGNDKHEEAHEEANLLHHLAAVELVVNKQ